MSSRGKTFLLSSYFIPFIAAVVLWCVSLHAFLFDQRCVVNDAVSYFQDTYALIESFLRGIFPIWLNGYFGIPNDFFLMRLGAFNPLYLVMAFLRLLGIPFVFVYLWTLSGYFFLGCYGFFQLCQRLTGHRLVSFIGFLLLYFSSLGTRIFDSFIILIFVPLMWFFFFFVDFCKKPSRLNFWGIVFTSMILFSTYILFYFLLIVCFAAFFFLLIFPKKFFEAGKRALSFFRREKIVSLIGVLAVFAAMLPGLLFFQASKHGDYVMSWRHHKVTDENAVEVHVDTIKKWAILEDIAFSTDFKDLRRMKFAVLYLPAMAWILLFIGLFGRFNRRYLYYLLFIGSLLALGIPQELPVYRFLRAHIPIFSYFRNLHFFLWWAMLPAFILLLCDQLAHFLEEGLSKKSGRLLTFLIVTLVHTFVLILVLRQEAVIAGTVVAIIGSWLVFGIYILMERKGNVLVWGLCFVAVLAVQPVEVYHYLGCNSKPGSSYNFIKRARHPFRYERTVSNGAQQEGIMRFYIALRPVQDMVESLGNTVFFGYTRVKLIAYDHVEILPDGKQDWDRIGRVLSTDQNLAFVDDWDEHNVLTDGGRKSTRITGAGQGIDVVHYDPNRIVFETHFVKPKFVVFNEAFHLGWGASLDGRKTRIYRANFAFKGVYIPAGKHTVVMRFHSLLWLRYLIWIIYLGVLGLLLWLGWTSSRQKGVQNGA